MIQPAPRPLKYFYFLLSLFLSSEIFSCDCPAFPPLTSAMFDTASPRFVVFMGKVVSVGPCKETTGSCVFDVQQLFFGSATKSMNAVFDCSTSCMMNIVAGEEWIIYAEYIQPGKISVEFCSRSRKIDPANNQEIEQLAYGLSSADELEWLQKKIGVKPVKEVDVSRLMGHKNEKPKPVTKIILLVVSIAALLLFMLGIKRFLK